MFWFLVGLIVLSWIINSASEAKGDTASKAGSALHMIAFLIFLFIIVVSCVDSCRYWMQRRSN